MSLNLIIVYYLQSTTYTTRKCTIKLAMNMNIRNNHIFELRIKIELYEDHRSEGVST